MRYCAITVICVYFQKGETTTVDGDLADILSMSRFRSMFNFSDCESQQDCQDKSQVGYRMGNSIFKINILFQKHSLTLKVFVNIYMY